MKSLESLCLYWAWLLYLCFSSGSTDIMECGCLSNPVSDLGSYFSQGWSVNEKRPPTSVWAWSWLSYQKCACDLDPVLEAEPHCLPPLLFLWHPPALSVEEHLCYRHSKIRSLWGAFIWMAYRGSCATSRRENRNLVFLLVQVFYPPASPSHELGQPPCYPCSCSLSGCVPECVSLL